MRVDHLERALGLFDLARRKVQAEGAGRSLWGLGSVKEVVVVVIAAGLLMIVLLLLFLWKLESIWKWLVACFEV